jgi:integrase
LSADTYLRQFGFLLERTKLNPTGVVALAKGDPDKLRDLLVRYAAQMKREGRLDSYISKFFEGLKSYLRFHRVPFDDFPSLSPIKGESLTSERVPTPEELAHVLDRLSIRGRVSALFMAHAGVRPGVLGSYQADTGLTLADLPDLKLGKEIAFAEVPFVVRVPASLSKTRVAYVTFGSSQLASVLLAYLAERREKGEILTSSSPIISVRSTRGVAERRRADPRYAKGFVVTKAVVEEIHHALKSAAPEGTRWRPYVLRSYASTRLLMAEGAGAMTRDLREAILGHDLGISGRYTLGKRWGDDLLKQARAAFKRCEPFLTTIPGAADKDEAAVKIKRLLLKVAGYSNAELDKANVPELTDEEIEKMVSDRVGRSAAAPTQEVVPTARVAPLLSQGWEVVTAIGPDQVVLRTPNGNGHRPPTLPLG